jgi:hypothetical protein
VTYWSESLREPHTSADMLAVNHARAQIFAPYQEPNVWGDLNEDAVRVSSASLAADAPAEPDAEPAAAGVWIGESEDGA